MAENKKPLQVTATHWLRAQAIAPRFVDQYGKIPHARAQHPAAYVLRMAITLGLDQMEEQLNRRRDNEPEA